MTFTTLKYLGEGLFQFAGAHLDLIIYRERTRSCELLATQGFWLNFIPDIGRVTKNSEFSLEKNDILVLYTDGLIETRNEKKELLDIEGLSQIIENNAGKPIEKMKDGIINEVLTRCGGKQDDDMTLVVIRRI